MSFRTAKPLVLVLAVQLFDPSHAALGARPSITEQPQNQAVCDGSGPYSGRANFYCGASGTTPLNFQWRRGTTNLANGVNIAGATTYHLIIQPAGPADAATDYNCLVTNSQGSAVTNNGTLSVWPSGTGDVNGDGAINGLDIQAFVNVWLSVRPPEGAMTVPYCAADMDSNGYLGCEDLCVFVQTLLQSSLGCGVAPENDDCPNATLISTGVTYSGSTAYATRDGPHISCESACSPQCDTGPDVWYEWVADFSGPADFSMCFGFGYDSVIAVYDACPLTGGVELACNDDFCNLGGIISRICGFTVNAGQTYWICVSGWGGDKGCFSFRVSPGGCN